MAQALNTIMVAMIATIGGIGLIALGLGIAVIHVSSKHKRLQRDLESHGFEITEAEVEAIPTRRIPFRRNTKFGFSRPEWNQLQSTESIQIESDTSDGATSNEPEDWIKQPRMPNIIIKPNVKPPHAMRTLKASPLMQVENSQGSVMLSNSPSPPPLILDRSERACPHGFYEPINILPAMDRHTMPIKPEPAFTDHQRSGSQEELRPLPLFSRSMDKLSKSEPRPRKKRSQTVGASSQPMEDPFGISKDSAAGSSRPAMHGRSISFGSLSPGTVPNAPVPPLPVVHNPAPRPRSWLRTRNLQRTVYRQSASSFESIGSSLLIGSPKVNRASSAKIRSGANREWKGSFAHGPRPLRKAYSMQDRTHSLANHKSSRSQKSIHSCEGQYSNGSSVAHHSANPSQQNSIPNHRNHASQALSYSNSNSTTPSQLPKTVTPGGSPKRLSALLPQSSGSPKSTGVSSTRSSNGNPFQWDSSSMQPGKPSAMKGSPTARKGHKRQQCVRISVPDAVIGSRPTSSGLMMADILEEGAEMTAFRSRESSSRPRSLPRPPSTANFAPDLRTSVLRASLTPSSPSLSMVNFSNDSTEHNHRHSLMSLRPSTRLSMFEIPSFPSPVKPPQEYDATFSYYRPIDNTNPQDQMAGIPDEFKLLARPISPPSPAHDSIHSTLSSSEDSLEQALLDSCHQNAEYVPETTLQPGEMILTFDSDGRLQVSPDDTHIPNSPTPVSSFSHRPFDSPPISPKSHSPPTTHKPPSTTTTIPGLTLTAPGNNTTSPTPVHEKSNSSGGSPVRESIQMLRRMNSDVRNVANRLAARRYVNLGSDGSPVPRPRRSSSLVAINNFHVDSGGASNLIVPGLGDSREDSMLEVQDEVDEMLAVPGSKDDGPASKGIWSVNDVEHLLDLQGFDALSAAAEALEPDRDDSETFGAAAISASGGRKSAKSTPVTTPLTVWEDGDEYWHHHHQHGPFTIEPNGQNFEDNMPKMVDGVSKERYILTGAENISPVSEHHVSRSGMDGSIGSLHGQQSAPISMGNNRTTPIKVNIVPPSNNGTPGSMYDAKGFLRGS